MTPGAAALEASQRNHWKQSKRTEVVEGKLGPMVEPDQRRLQLPSQCLHRHHLEVASFLDGGWARVQRARLGYRQEVGIQRHLSPSGSRSFLKIPARPSSCWALDRDIPDPGWRHAPASVQPDSSLYHGGLGLVENRAIPADHAAKASWHCS